MLSVLCISRVQLLTFHISCPAKPDTAQASSVFNNRYDPVLSLLCILPGSVADLLVLSRSLLQDEGADVDVRHVRQGKDFLRRKQDGAEDPSCVSPGERQEEEEEVGLVRLFVLKRVCRGRGFRLHVGTRLTIGTLTVAGLATLRIPEYFEVKIINIGTKGSSVGRPVFYGINRCS